MNAKAKKTEDAKPEETKADKWVRLVNFRVPIIMDRLDQLGNLSNKSCYDYTPEQADALEKTLQGKLTEIMAQFRKEGTTGNTFDINAKIIASPATGAE